VGDTGYAADVFDRFLYTIDLSSNAATALPISPRDSPITGLASSDGTNPRMYGALILDDEIIEIDPTTGDSLGVRVSGLPGSVTSLAYGSDDNLWFIPALRTTLYSADPETGTITATLMGLDVGHVSGLTAVLPGPGAIGLFGLAGLAGRRRRRV